VDVVPVSLILLLGKNERLIGEMTMGQAEERTKKRIKLVRHSRVSNWKDRAVIFLFRGALLRWCDRHLNYAQEDGLINNDQLHSLDAQMKGDLGFPGYPQP